MDDDYSRGRIQAATTREKEAKKPYSADSEKEQHEANGLSAARNKSEGEMGIRFFTTLTLSSHLK
uniref:Uncharacterized protein n=1 Tax=Cucumis melo TaxID=3656 RepID=A0A9I9DWJ2_CUCME